MYHSFCVKTTHLLPKYNGGTGIGKHTDSKRKNQERKKGWKVLSKFKTLKAKFHEF
jgi:hypothetical protein